MSGPLGLHQFSYPIRTKSEENCPKSKKGRWAKRPNLVLPNITYGRKQKGRIEPKMQK